MLNILDISDLSVVSDLQVEESWVEYTCKDELDNMRLAIARQLGQVEPDLYPEDHEQDPDDLLGDEVKEDWEKVLNNVIDIQERLATGMKMIQQCKDVLTAAQQKRIPYDAYIAWCERHKALWSHWHALKAQSDELIGENKWLWYRYFSLAESALDTIGFTNDETECPVWLKNLDEMTEWYDDSVDDYQE